MNTESPGAYVAAQMSDLIRKSRAIVHQATGRPTTNLFQAEERDLRRSAHSNSLRSVYLRAVIGQKVIASWTLKFGLRVAPTGVVHQPVRLPARADLRRAIFRIEADFHSVPSNLELNWGWTTAKPSRLVGTVLPGCVAVRAAGGCFAIPLRYARSVRPNQRVSFLPGSTPGGAAVADDLRDLRRA